VPRLDTFASVFAFQAIAGTAFYLLAASISYAITFRAYKSRFHPQHVPVPEHRRREILWSVASIVGNAALTAPIQLAVTRGSSKVYFDVGAHGMAWLIASVVLYLAVTETLIYWIHRALHAPFLYARLHKHHHAFREPTPYSAFAFHPLDSFAQAAPHHLCAFLFPVHVAVYAGFLVFVSVWSVLIHDRVRIVRAWSVNGTGHHTAHHRYNKANYGQFFTFWDRLAGTHRAPDT
jgi:lathosterol oxidase